MVSDKISLLTTDNDFIEFVHNWVKLCAAGEINHAFSLLDEPLDKSRHTWTPDDINEITYDHFGDEKYSVITNPDTVEGNIRTDIYKYNDGSGWVVEYDLPLNGVVSDFTLIFEFIEHNGKLRVVLDDCHVM